MLGPCAAVLSDASPGERLAMHQNVFLILKSRHSPNLQTSEWS